MIILGSLNANSIKTMKILRNLILAGLLAGIVNAPLFGQCETGTIRPRKRMPKTLTSTIASISKAKTSPTSNKWRKKTSRWPSASGEPTHVRRRWPTFQSFPRRTYLASCSVQQSYRCGQRVEYAAAIMRLYDEQIKVL